MNLFPRTVFIKTTFLKTVSSCRELGPVRAPCALAQWHWALWHATALVAGGPGREDKEAHLQASFSAQRMSSCMCFLRHPHNKPGKGVFIPFPSEGTESAKLGRARRGGSRNAVYSLVWGERKHWSFHCQAQSFGFQWQLMREGSGR